MTPPRVLLVAKPWQGGLATYLERALEEHFAAPVTWFASYPRGFVESMRYRTSRGAWRRALIDAVNGTARELALFVNLPPHARDLAPHPGNVLWLTDAPAPRAEELAPFARIFVSDPGHAAPVAALAGARFAGTMPFACDPQLHAACAGDAARDVCFIGNRDPKRDAHLAALLHSGLACTVVGNYFGRHPLFWRQPASFRPRVPIAGMGRVYARHRLALNVHAAVVREGTNMRTFECAGYGIAQVVEHRPGLEQLFEPGVEIATYRAPGELPGMLRALARDDGARARLAGAARRRALAEHTYRRRVEALFDAMA